MTLNGEPIDTFEGTVAEFVDSQLLRREGVAVAVNGEVVPRSLWSVTQLDASSEIEFVTAAAGG